MYEELCDVLLNNGVRLIYTTNRFAARTIDTIGQSRPAVHGELCFNEKIAYELALAGSYMGKRTACLLTTEGLYETMDPVMSSAYTGVIGGCLLIAVMETEEKVTPVGLFSKVPLIVTETYDEFRRACEFGYTISEKYEIPVIIQTKPEADERVEPSGLSVRQSTPNPELRTSNFIKNPDRWAATPKFRYLLHKSLNEKTEKIREEFERYEGNTRTDGSMTGVITDSRSGLEFYDDDASLLYLATIYPMPTKLVDKFIAETETFYIAEGPYPAIELQIRDRSKMVTVGIGGFAGRTKPAETMYGFDVVRDTLGPASSINMAHGIKSMEPGRKILAITFEDHFFHSGMAAFVNTLYNGSTYVLLILVNEKEDTIRTVLEGFGFRNAFHIDHASEVERFKDREELTVLFCRGIV